MWNRILDPSHCRTGGFETLAGARSSTTDGCGLGRCLQLDVRSHHGRGSRPRTGRGYWGTPPLPPRTSTTPINNRGPPTNQMVVSTGSTGGGPGVGSGHGPGFDGLNPRRPGKVRRTDLVSPGSPAAARESVLLTALVSTGSTGGAPGVGSGHGPGFDRLNPRCPGSPVRVRPGFDGLRRRWPRSRFGSRTWFRQAQPAAARESVRLTDLVSTGPTSGAPGVGSAHGPGFDRLNQRWPGSPVRRTESRPGSTGGGPGVGSAHGPGFDRLNRRWPRRPFG